MSKIYSQYRPTNELEVIVEEPDQKTGPCIIRLRHTPRPRDMNGEIVFAPSHLPEITKALTQAALDAYLRDNYLAGHRDGLDVLKPELHKAISKYYSTTEGKEAWTEDKNSADKIKTRMAE